MHILKMITTIYIINIYYHTQLQIFLINLRICSLSNSNREYVINYSHQTGSKQEKEYGELFFKQIAGTFARRIVCYAEPGNSVIKGDQCGIIKFGSRIDMFFPLDADIKVKIGDYVRASESVIAELKK